MKKLIVSNATLAAALVALTGIASALMAPPPTMISPCGSYIGVCSYYGTSSTSSSSSSDDDEATTDAATTGGTLCESSSSGSASAGSSSEACMYEDGSSTWKFAEWGAGYFVEDSGSATVNGDGSVTTITKHFDYAM